MNAKIWMSITAFSLTATAFAAEEPTAFEYLKRRQTVQVDVVAQYCHENAPEADQLVSEGRASFMSSLEQGLEIWLAEKPKMKQTLLQKFPTNSKERLALEQKIQELRDITNKTAEAIKKYDPHTYCPLVANKFKASTSGTVLKLLHDYDKRVEDKNKSLKDELVERTGLLEDRKKSLQAEFPEPIKYEPIRPKKIYITRKTDDIVQAVYFRMVGKKIEQLGTEKFPVIDGRHLYGNLIVSIPIFQDGSIFDRDGGPRVELSSGDPQLDKAALIIARQAAPFDAIPDNQRSKDRDDVWVIITTFNFTNEKVPFDTESEPPH
jgi:hypothetical protein